MLAAESLAEWLHGFAADRDDKEVARQAIAVAAFGTEVAPR